MTFQEFSVRALGLELWPHQLEAAESGAFVTCIAKARRTGGTVLAEALAAYVAFSTRGCRVIALSATQDAARRLTESIGLRLSRSPFPAVRGAVTDDFATRIRLANGSEIVSLPASQRQVRGYGEGVRLVILDEASFMDPALWRAAHYVALDERASGSRVLMLGTPWGGPEHFFRRAFEAGRDGDPDHASFHWTFEVSPRLDRAYLERLERRVSPQEYRAEVLGEWSDAEGALFPWSTLEPLVATELELPSLAELRAPARPIVGTDYGVSFDRSAAAVVYRLPVGSLNVGEPGGSVWTVVPHVWPVGHPLDDVALEVARSPVPWAYVSTEVNGVGAGPSQTLRRELPRAQPRTKRTWNFVHTTNATKTAGYGAWLSLFEQRRVVLPNQPDLLRQLAGLRFEHGERGFTRIEPESPAAHDDVADALYLSALPYSPRGEGRVVCALRALAEAGLPDAAVPELDEPVIETAGGLRVWRRPPLQSAADQSVTLPPGALNASGRRDEPMPLWRRAGPDDEPRRRRTHAARRT